MADKPKALDVLTAPDSTTRKISIDELIPEPQNARVRNNAAKAALKKSLKEFGPARSLVVDGAGVVRAGNGTLEAAKAAGIEEVIVVEANGKQLVVVERADWSDEEAELYGLSDNKLGELSGWDDGVVVEKLQRLVGGAELKTNDIPGFNIAELQSFLGTEIAPKMNVEFEAALRKLEGMEDTSIVIVVPKKHEDKVREWLSNGEGTSGPQLGFGVLKRCGLLS